MHLSMPRTHDAIAIIPRSMRPVKESTGAVSACLEYAECHATVMQHTDPVSMSP